VNGVPLVLWASKEQKNKHYFRDAAGFIKFYPTSPAGTPLNHAQKKGCPGFPEHPFLWLSAYAAGWCA